MDVSRIHGDQRFGKHLAERKLLISEKLDGLKLEPLLIRIGRSFENSSIENSSYPPTGGVRGMKERTEGSSLSS
jgi:hypothetical protein